MMDKDLELGMVDHVGHNYAHMLRLVAFEAYQLD